MAYRNKTYVAFASEDIHYYRMMLAWRARECIEFNFFDAHDVNTARDTSQVMTIERRLTERLQHTKQVVLIVGEKTREKAGDGVSFLHHECKVIKKLGLPVVFANANGIRLAQVDRIPALLMEVFSVSVSFQPAIIKHALDSYVGMFPNMSREAAGPHYYLPDVYRGLGI